MGGSWDLSRNRCWDPCLLSPQSLANSVNSLVATYNLDGVDINYEDISESEERRAFLVDLTTKIRAGLQKGKLLSHSPMDHATELGDGYLAVLNQIHSVVDFVAIQYFNGVPHFAAASTHYQNVVSAMGDDASKVLYGFCISECGVYNLDASAAVNVLHQLSFAWPLFGGVMAWSIQGDSTGAWASTVSQHLLLLEATSRTTESTTATIASLITSSSSAATSSSSSSATAHTNPGVSTMATPATTSKPQTTEPTAPTVILMTSSSSTSPLEVTEVPLSVAPTFPQNDVQSPPINSTNVTLSLCTSFAIALALVGNLAMLTMALVFL